MPSLAKSQQKKIAKDDKNIVNILQRIEQTSDWIFNFDVQSLSEYTIAEPLKKGDIKTQLTQLFYKTPYTFEIQDQSILIFLDPPKTYRFCGTIRDKESHTTLPLANIFTNDQQHGTQTDMNGNFDFSFTAYKHQLITISYIGYQSQSYLIQELIQNNCPTIFLEIDTELFGEEIIIKDYILPEITEGESYGGVHIDYQQLAKRQTIIEQDILKTVQLIPGINSIDESATNLQIRGGTPDQNLILWEDVTLYDPGHLFGMLSAINPYVIEEVQVFKGAFDPRYDNRVGGIVDLSLDDAVANKFQGGVGTTLTEAHAYLKMPIIDNKLSILLSGRNSINRIYNSPTLQNYSTKVFQGSRVEDEKEDVEEDEFDANQQLDFFDINGKILFQPNDQWTFKASWLNTQNTFDYQTTLFEDDRFTLDNVRFDSKALNISSLVQLKKNWQVKLSYSNSFYRNDYLQTKKELEDDFIFEENSVYNDIEDEGIVVQSDYQINTNWKVQAGYDFNRKNVNLNVATTDLYEEDLIEMDFFEGHFHNVFASFNYQQKKLQLNGGFRSTYFTEANHLGFAPRFNIQYALSDKLKLKASSGIFQQYISQLREFGENSLDLNNQVWILNYREEGDNVLQSAKKIAGGFIFQQHGWLIDLEGYFHQTNGLSTLGSSFGNSSAASEIDDFSTGSAQAMGMDFLLKKRWENYQSWLNYSLSKVDFNFPEAVDGGIFPASNEQRHILSWTNSYTYKKWDFSLSYQFKTGLPYTEALSVEDEFDEELFAETGDVLESTYYFIEYGAANGKRLPNYSRLDFGISYRPTFRKSNLSGEFTFSIINLLNRTNTFRRDYFLDDLDEDEFLRPELFTEDKRLLKRTPLVSMRIYW